jgi:hypothetical protein
LNKTVTYTAKRLTQFKGKRKVQRNRKEKKKLSLCASVAPAHGITVTHTFYLLSIWRYS